MDANGGRESQLGAPPTHRGWGQRWLKVLAVVAVVACLLLVVSAEYILHHAEPILRKRIVETLSTRFDAPVELDRLSISLLNGIEVNGWGLRIPVGTGNIAGTHPDPMISAGHFAFRTTISGLFRDPMHVVDVRVDGMELHIPPPGQRSGIFGRDPTNPHTKAKIAIIVNELRCRSVQLFLASSNPGRQPLEFDIASLDMQDVGEHQAMLYDAQLTSPKPAGTIHAVGHFGPWAGSTTSKTDQDPGQTPLDGNYSFDRADLNSIKGIGGTLSSTGHFAGILDRISVEGETEVPNFSLDISNRPMPLHTQFQAVVDGTSGDTFLDPLQARLGHSEFTVSGKIVKVNGSGHDILLDIGVPHGRMQDFLRLASKTDPPLMNAVLTMTAKLHIPSGDARVAKKLAMQGAFQLANVQFNNQHLQDRIDGLSARAQGQPQKVKVVSEDRRTEGLSHLGAGFTINQGLMTATDVRFTVPGATVLLNGVYSMDGHLFEFKGHVRTEATASEMVGGWRGLLLKPFDRFVKKDGAGLQLPIEISGTGSDVHFGLAMHGTDETPRQMLADAREKQHDKRDMAQAKREAARADADDVNAAHASTLAEAERAHNSAVRHRAEAQSKATAAQRSTPHRSPEPRSAPAAKLEETPGALG